MYKNAQKLNKAIHFTKSLKKDNKNYTNLSSYYDIVRYVSGGGSGGSGGASGGGNC